jgi:hypothetical protein
MFVWHRPAGYIEILVLPGEMTYRSILGKFSLASLVIKLVSGMGLLTLTATIVDTLALYVLPDRFRYRSYVYETSPVHEKEIKQD